MRVCEFIDVMTAHDAAAVLGEIIPLDNCIIINSHVYFPSITSSFNRKASGKNRDNLLCVGACSTAEGVTIIRKVDSDSSRGITGDYVDCSVLSWNVPVSEGGSSRILEETACVFSNFKIHKDENFMSICAHVGSRSISVFFSSPIDAHRVEGGKLCQLRWRKYDSYNGSLLFEKRMGLDGMRGADKARNVFSAISAGPLLWLVFDGRASLWDPRYGVELCNVATYIPLDFPSERSTDFHAMGYSSDTSSSQTSIFALTVCVPHAGGCSIFNTSLKVPTAQTTGDTFLIEEIDWNPHLVN